MRRRRIPPAVPQSTNIRGMFAQQAQRNEQRVASSVLDSLFGTTADAIETVNAQEDFELYDIPQMTAPSTAVQSALAQAFPSSPVASFEMTSRDDRYNRRQFNMNGDDLKDSAWKLLESMPCGEMVRFHFWRYDSDGQRHDWGTKLMTVGDHLEKLGENYYYSEMAHDAALDAHFGIQIGDSETGGKASGGGATSSGSGGGSGVEESPWVQQMTGKALYSIKNEDDLCGQRCLVLADMTESNRKTMHKRPESFTKKAKDMAKRIGVNGRMEQNDFDKYAALKKRQVVIFMSKRDVAYSTPLHLSVKPDGTQAEPVFICWDSEQSHYHYILNIQAFCSNGDSHERWCGPCQKMVRKEWWLTHKCEGIKCKKCCTKFESQADLDAHLKLDDVKNTAIKCPDCNYYYANEECLAAHKTMVYVPADISAGTVRRESRLPRGRPSLLSVLLSTSVVRDGAAIAKCSWWGLINVTSDH